MNHESRVVIDLFKIPNAKCLFETWEQRGNNSLILFNQVSSLVTGMPGLLQNVSQKGPKWDMLDKSGTSEKIQ